MVEVEVWQEEMEKVNSTLRAILEIIDILNTRIDKQRGMIEVLAIRVSKAEQS